jgi:hypothetical protein
MVCLAAVHDWQNLHLQIVITINTASEARKSQYTEKLHVECKTPALSSIVAFFVLRVLVYCLLDLQVKGTARFQTLPLYLKRVKQPFRLRFFDGCRQSDFTVGSYDDLWFIERERERERTPLTN